MGKIFNIAMIVFFGMFAIYFFLSLLGSIALFLSTPSLANMGNIALSGIVLFINLEGIKLFWDWI